MSQEPGLCGCGVGGLCVTVYVWGLDVCGAVNDELASSL